MCESQLYKWLRLGSKSGGLDGGLILKSEETMKSTNGEVLSDQELNSNIVRCVSAVGLLLQLRKHINTDINETFVPENRRILVEKSGNTK